MNFATICDAKEVWIPCKKVFFSDVNEPEFFFFGSLTDKQNITPSLRPEMNDYPVITGGTKANRNLKISKVYCF